MWLTIIYMSIIHRWFLLIGVTLPGGVLTLAEKKMFNLIKMVGSQLPHLLVLDTPTQSPYVLLKI